MAVTLFKKALEERGNGEWEWGGEVPYRPGKYKNEREGRGFTELALFGVCETGCSLEYHYHDPTYVFNTVYMISNDFSTVIHVFLNIKMLIPRSVSRNARMLSM